MGDCIANGNAENGIWAESNYGGVYQGSLIAGNVFEIGTDPTAGPWANFCKGTGCPP